MTRRQPRRKLPRRPSSSCCSTALLPQQPLCNSPPNSRQLPRPALQVLLLLPDLTLPSIPVSCSALRTSALLCIDQASASKLPYACCICSFAWGCPEASKYPILSNVSVSYLLLLLSSLDHRPQRGCYANLALRELAKYMHILSSPLVDTHAVLIVETSDSCCLSNRGLNCSI